jgi:thiosulfate reductase/polysulfide reductase chain A
LKKEMSETRDYKSVCRSCHGGCGVVLSVKNNRVVKVIPDKDSPFSKGYMCIKGLKIMEMMYHPERLLFPLKRVGSQKSKKWERISWERALTEITEKIDTLRQEFGPESIAIGQGTGRHHFMDVIRFANALGTPNWYEPGLANCFIPRITVCNFTYGGFVSADYYGKTFPRTIMFWGHNPLLTSPDGELSALVQKAMKNGAYGIAIDPRKSETAQKCKLWLPIRPGTDCALALAMIHYIINENLYDRDFVENYTTGFQKLKAHVQAYSLAWAEEITGIPVNLIIVAAKRYAMEKPSVLEWGVAIEQTPNTLQTVRAIALLRGITGNLDAPGSDIFGASLLKPYPLLKSGLAKEMGKKRLGASEFKLLGGFRAFMPSAHIPAVMRAMKDGDPYKIRALLNFGSNPLVTIANSRKVYDAILALELVVVSDMFMTPTAAMADYILPASFWPEVNQVVEIPYVAVNAVMAQQKVVTVGECRQDEDMLIDLAKRLNLPGADQSFEEIVNFRLSGLDITFEELKKKRYIFPEPEYYKYKKRKNGFRTPSGKVELYSKSLKRMGYDPLPIYREPPESPVSTKELYKTYPYVLTTGSRRKEFFHSDNRQIETLRQRRPSPVAEINTQDAADNGIKHKDIVSIASPRGKITMQALVTNHIVKGVVNIDHGWWFPEKADSDFGLWESNANLLTSDEPPYDPAFGTYQLRALLCSIQKVKAN